VTASALGIKANLIYYDKLSPYALLGMGLYFVDKEFVTNSIRERAKKTLFGLQFGVGADLDISDLFFAGMGFHLHNMFSNNVTLANAGRVELSGREAILFFRAGVRF
jgi:opacity protein-like surface antigen